MNTRFALRSPPSSGNAAIAIVELLGDVDGVLATLDVAPIAPPGSALRPVPGVDTLVIARPASDRAFIFPHAGPVVLRRLFDALLRSGAELEHDQREAGLTTDIDLREDLAGALAKAASPLAIDLLLDQPRRWSVPGLPRVSETNARFLARLIDPPMVVALGPPNIGKSSLLNALAGRTVSIVADEPGTTRDHVGASIEFGGLVVRYIDAPGISLRPDPDPIQAQAQNLALRAAARSDLVLVCGDRASGFPVAPPEGVQSLRVALRADLGLPEGCVYDVAVSVKAEPSSGYRTSVQTCAHPGIERLVGLVRDALVPPTALADPGAWDFRSRPAEKGPTSP
ncbi:MAG: GTPase [Phycisphaerales bacterium]